ncbi:hypothetical protein [Halorubrum tebenquichense]|uniref:Uncharacterized protein n=1 Tax=Halorubrum tebenquichense DSM 14210 TaxID=1227485 RepID=M0DKY5_9EURY|nr:hypothetical protein [Halorubrum tebenquichense]ELZ35377.1 hypothetical protein C472_12605 [Halorubrum tebenquichense DSM 14210]
MSGAKPRGSTDHFDRFDNAEEAKEFVDKREETKREQRKEAVEVYGAAAELFEQRVLDTVAIERHGTEIEFYRPVDATDADLSAIAENRPELADRLKRGSEHITAFEEAQRQALQVIGSAGDEGVSAEDLEQLHGDAMEGTETIRKALSCFAVDDSFRDPDIWKTIFQSEDTVRELFEDFFSEGDREKLEARRDVLQNMVGAGDSTS